MSAPKARSVFICGQFILAGAAMPGPAMDGQLTDRVLCTFYDVYTDLRHGYLESVYARAMAVALRGAGLHVEEQFPIAVHFRGVIVGEFRADVLVEDRLLLELKACRAIEAAHEAQLLNYLRATRFEMGLLLNFGPRPAFKRLIFTNDRKRLEPVEGTSPA